ncbi:MAG TPA: hypothetical protein VIL48_23115 [Acidimicrobiales bacterium]
MTAETPAASLRARPATYAGLFIVTLTTLMYEIVLTRIFSVAMWYHFAFVAISVALFGMTAGALIVHLRPRWFRDEMVKQQMWRFSLLYAVSVAVAFVVQLAIPFVPHMTMAGVSSIVLTCVVISVPFVCSGVVVCLALTRFPKKVNRLYAADLVGAGLGCVLLVVAFWWLDGPSLVIGIGALACVAAVAFAYDAGVRPSRKLLSAGVLAVLVLVTAGNAYRHSQGNPFIRILWAKEQQDTLHTYDRWNAFSRITVDGQPTDVGRPAGYGMSPEMPEDIVVPQMSMLIDGTAGTMITGYDGDESTTDFLRYDITNLGYYPLDGTDFTSAVIGVGGGRDVLTGLEFGAREVTGIEINGNILDLTTDELGDFTNLTDDPRVRLVNDEARSWLTRTDERFDMIQMSLIDTWAASSAGAFALTENSLYTTDAWQTFFDRLSPDGILSVSRWYTIGGAEPFETLRTAALATEVLTRNGVENPRDHVLIYKGPEQQFASSAATILVSPSGFDDEALTTIDENAERLGFEPILTPTAVADQRFADIVAPGGPDAGIEQFDEDLSPPSDDRPFFFQMASLDTFLSGEGFSNDLVFRPVLVLGSLALAVLLLAAVFIGGPLASMGRKVQHRGMSPFYLYFAGIGLGFMLVEFSQLQRLNTFLGHPTYALAVVLFTLLLFSGLGSMLVERVIDPARPRSLLVPVGVLLVILLVFGAITDSVTDAAAGGTTPVRIGVAIGLLAPLALLMGMPFSIGMGAASRREGAPTAFLWGINGAMSVVASVCGALMAMFFGISVTFASGFVAYLVAAVALFLVVRRLVGGGAAGPEQGADRDGDAAAPEAGADGEAEGDMTPAEPAAAEEADGEAEDEEPEPATVGAPSSASGSSTSSSSGGNGSESPPDESG